jgi:hypothetical protein
MTRDRLGSLIAEGVTLGVILAAIVLAVIGG